jgi:hypothetical protein
MTTINDTLKPTAQVQAKIEYVLHVSKEEMRLLCLALAGKLGSGSGPKAARDAESARLLNVRLLEMAHRTLAAQVDSLENALELAPRTPELDPEPDR